MQHTPMPFDQDLVDSWAIAMRAERKSSSTVTNYLSNVTAYARWCEQHDYPEPMDRRAFEAHLADIIEEGRLADTTVALRHISVRRFSAWLAEEERVDDVLLPVRRPKIDEKVVQPLTPDELSALILACRGVAFLDRRDDALVRIMAETGPRASDVLSMTVDGTKLKDGTALLRGKGGKERVIGFGPQTARCMDRYLRMRKTHRLAGEAAFWLGDRGASFGYPGLYTALARRAEQAGIADFHPHRLRHTFSDRWLANGGSEGGLMAVAGWKNRNMVDKYARARAAARALEESRGLNLGDL